MRCPRCGYEIPSALLDVRAITEQYGVSQHVAEAWMRRLAKVRHPGGVRKVFVRRADLEALLNSSSIGP